MIRNVFFLLILFTGIASAQKLDIEKYREVSEKKWTKAIAGFSKKNQSEKHPDDSILFVGSSSIRLWKDIDADMQPYHAIQRGFGGSTWSDVAVFADQIIKPHTFRAVVFFVGNDIAGKKDDKAPEEVASLFEYVVNKVRAHNPKAAIFYIAVTPASSRFKVWPKIRAANTKVENYCKKADNVHFIATESSYLNANGKPRDELFLKDRLHLNRDGYILWRATIKKNIDSVLK